MRITILLPFVNLTGGIRVHLDYARELRRRGHSVRVLYPARPFRFADGSAHWLREWWRTSRSAVPTWAAHLAEKVTSFADRHLPDADVVVAVSWPVVLAAATLPPRCGRLVHIMMHHEAGTGSEHEIRSTYRIPAYRIAYSTSAALDFATRFGCRIDCIVPNGVDLSTFYPDGAAVSPGLLLLHHRDPRKGTDIGIDAAARIRSVIPGIRVLAAGMGAAPSLPHWISRVDCPDDHDLRRLYSTNMLLYPSRLEGFGLPPLEAMACGGLVVTSNTGAVPEYATHGVDSMLVDVGDVEGMANAALAVLKSQDYSRRLHMGGPVTAARYGLSRVTACFEGALLGASRPRQARLLRP